MADGNIFKLDKPGQDDPLQEVLREGARKMLAATIESEVASFIDRRGSIKTDEGQTAVVRNGYLPERSIQTGLGDIGIKVPKVRDRSGTGIKFNRIAKISGACPRDFRDAVKQNGDQK